MALEFEIDRNPGAGRSLFSKARPTGLKPTAVHFAAAHRNERELDVVLWLHGYYVRDLRFLFHGDRAQVVEQVEASGKGVVLIAPFLGHTYRKDGKAVGSFSASGLGGKGWGERYLDEVLQALSASDKRGPDATFQVRNLVLACHSAGGAGMRALVDTLGRYRARLRQCWGFDCLYGRQVRPDDATFWHATMLAKGAVPLFIVYGGSTIWQSVKLDQMARGRADARGRWADPPTHPPMTDVQVEIGPRSTFQLDRLRRVVTRRLTAPLGGGQRTALHVEQVARDQLQVVKFDDDVHYLIAREGLRARLAALPF